MKVLFIARSNCHIAKGGDMVQLINTAARLKNNGIDTDIRLAHEKIDYSGYSLLHFFNICRPWDMLYHIQKAGLPYILSPIPVNYFEYDKYHRKGLSGLILRYLPSGSMEYIKTIARWMIRKDVLVSKSYLWKGHNRSIYEIMEKALLILPNSRLEYQQLVNQFPACSYSIIPNGIDTDTFSNSGHCIKKSSLVLCAARIEGIKNQLNLIKALNNTSYQLIIIGSPAPNQLSYYKLCRKIAAPNITFIDHLPQDQLVHYYRQAKVHVLPSWFETCGLSSLEAAAMKCNLVITDKGYTREYFGEQAFYCNPADPDSIRKAVEQAAASKCNENLQQTIFQKYTWQQAAALTAAAYKKVLQTI